VTVVVERSPSVLSRRVGAAWLVTTRDDPDVHELQGGAAIVWERLEGPTTLEELVAGLEADGVEEPSLREQVEDVVRDLTRLDAVREVAAT
jgi:hypothetical protein